MKPEQLSGETLLLGTLGRRAEEDGGWTKSSRSSDGLCCVIVKVLDDAVLIGDSKARRDPRINRFDETVIRVAVDVYDTWLDTLTKPVTTIVPGAPVVVRTEDGYELHSTNDDAVLAYTDEEWIAFLGGLDELRSDVLLAA